MKPGFSQFVLWALCSTFLWMGQSSSGADSTQPQVVGSVPMPDDSSDRGKSQNGASAMAMAASALQQVMAMKLMAEAVAENNSEKMAMASMMMAQAAANAANAAQNKESAKKVTSSNQMMATAPTFEKPNIDTQPKPDNFDLGLNASKEKNSANSESKKETTPIDIASNQESKPGSIDQQEKKFDSNSKSAPNISDLTPSPSSSFALKDSNRSSLMGMTSSSPGLGMQNNWLPPATMNSNQSGSQVADNKPEKKPSSKSSEPINGAQSGNMDDLMARYMNGAGAFGAISSAGLGGGMIDLAFGLQPPGQRPKTIFEFASEQYGKIKSNGRALQKQRPIRRLASE